jgi:hypothetical protein
LKMTALETGVTMAATESTAPSRGLAAMHSVYEVCQGRRNVDYLSDSRFCRIGARKPNNIRLCSNDGFDHA